MNMAPESLVPVLLALQFAAFGWRINRQIPLGDAGRRMWFPLADFINIVSMIIVVTVCVVHPLASGQFHHVAKAVLGTGYLLVALHPINTAAHYRLFSRSDRSVYKDSGRNYPYVTGQEMFTLLLSVVLVFLAARWLWHTG